VINGEIIFNSKETNNDNFHFNEIVFIKTDFFQKNKNIFYNGKAQTKKKEKNFVSDSKQTIINDFYFQFFIFNLSLISRLNFLEKSFATS
jgi:hypothetical protein